MPEVYLEIAALRERLAGAPSVGLVPTMGALHRGHAKLLETARRENDLVVATIFVNPTQFDRKEDLENYPRTMDEDLRVCDNCGVDVVFAPTAQEIYPDFPGAPLTFVDLPALTAHLCGAHRPGHFRGVATVVLKLLNIVQPHRAYFGEKDAQQLAVIRRMVADLNVPVTIIPVATVREPDGVALSSRNKHLTPEQRALAPLLSRSLRAAVNAVDHGERSTGFLRDAAQTIFAPYSQVRLEYFEITDPDTLIPVERIAGPVLIAAAMWLGSTRLIDNISWAPRSSVA